MTKKIVFGLTPLIVVFLSVLSYGVYLWSSNFTPRMYFYSQDVHQLDRSELKVRYSLYSQEDYLGIVSIDGNAEFGYPISDIIFRIRPEDSQDWIVENTYVASDLKNREAILFGLPVQEVSKGKTFIFEIEAECYEDEECHFDPGLSTVMVRHYFSKRFFIQQPVEAFSIIVGKIYQNLLVQPLWEKIFVLIAPVSIYLVVAFFAVTHYHSKLVKIVKAYSRIYGKQDIFLFSAVLIDVVFQSTLLFYILFIGTIWYLGKVKKNLLPHFCVVMFVVLYYSGVVMELVNFSFLARRLALWAFAYLFVVVFNFFLYQCKKAWLK